MTEEQIKALELASEAYSLAFRAKSFDPESLVTRFSFFHAQTLLSRASRSMDEDGIVTWTRVKDPEPGMWYIFEYIHEMVVGGAEYGVADLIRYHEETVNGD